MVHSVGFDDIVLDIFPLTRYFGKGAVAYEELKQLRYQGLQFFGNKIEQAKVCLIYCNKLCTEDQYSE